MKKIEFKAWLKHLKNVNKDYASILARIEEEQQIDCDIEYNKDKCKKLLELFEYSKADERAKKNVRHTVNIVTQKSTERFYSLYNSTNQYKTTIKRYVEFREFYDKIPQTINKQLNSATKSQDESDRVANIDVFCQIAIRRGQNKFRNELLVEYNNECAVTGCKIKDILEAAHIIPYALCRECNISNGIILRSDIHTLFDLRLINIVYDRENDTFRLLIMDELKCDDACHEALINLHGKVIPFNFININKDHFIKNIQTRFQNLIIDQLDNQGSAH